MAACMLVLDPQGYRESVQGDIAADSSIRSKCNARNLTRLPEATMANWFAKAADTSTPGSTLWKNKCEQCPTSCIGTLISPCIDAMYCVCLAKLGYAIAAVMGLLGIRIQHKRKFSSLALFRHIIAQKPRPSATTSQSTSLRYAHLFYGRAECAQMLIMPQVVQEWSKRAKRSERGRGRSEKPRPTLRLRDCSKRPYLAHRLREYFEWDNR